MGKSKLAVKYAMEPEVQAKYNVIWRMNANSKRTLLASYKELGLTLNCVQQNQCTNVVANIKEFLQNSTLKWLFIFDQADTDAFSKKIEQKWLPKVNGDYMMTST